MVPIGARVLCDDALMLWLRAERSRDDAIRKAQFDACVTMLRGALALRPRYAPALVARARGLRKFAADGETKGTLSITGVEDVKRAIRMLNKVAEREPRFAAAYNALAACYRRQGNPGGAVDANQKAIELEPNFARAYFDLGCVQGGACVCPPYYRYRRLSFFRPIFAIAHFSFPSSSAGDQQKVKEAIETWYKCLECNPRHAVCCLNLGAALKHVGRDKDGVAMYRRAMRLDPAEAKTPCYLGTLLSCMGYRSEAIRAYRRRIALRPDDSDVLMLIGNEYKAQGKIDAALAEFRRALAMDPKSVEAHLFLGATLADRRDDGGMDPHTGGEYKGEYGEAIELFKKLLQLDPKNHIAHLKLGEIYARTDRRVHAVRYYRKAIEIKPKVALTHFRLGITLMLARTGILLMPPAIKYGRARVWGL